MGGVITTIAKVEAVDVTNRLLTVAVPEGNTMVTKLGPHVQNIETIKIRDRVTVSYSEEVATSLRSSLGRPSTRTTRSRARKSPA